MNLLKKGKGVPLLNFEGVPGVSLLNFEGGPKVALLNFEGDSGSRGPGPTFTPCHFKLNLLFVCFYCLVDLQCHCSYKVCSSKIHCLLWYKKVYHKQIRQAFSFCHSLPEFEYQSITKHELIFASSLIKNGICFIGNYHVSCGGITEPYPATL